MRNRKHPQIALERAYSFLQQNMFSEALIVLASNKKTLRGNLNALVISGYANSMLKQYQSAIDAYEQAILINNSVPDFHLNLGVCLLSLNRHEESVPCFLRAIEIQNSNSLAYLNLGTAYKELKKYELALAQYINAIAIDPVFYDAWLNVGEVYLKLGQVNEAIQSGIKAIQISPEDERGYYNLGMTYLELNKFEESLFFFNRTLDINSSCADAINNSGVALIELRCFDEAVNLLSSLVKKHNEFAPAYYNLGVAYGELSNNKESACAFMHAFILDPNLTNLKGSLLHAKLKNCDWDGFKKLSTNVIQSINSNEQAATPFQILGIPSDLNTQKICSEIAVKKFPTVNTSKFISIKPKIRVGYMSSDFYSHATSFLISELIELHARSDFDVIGFCYGKSPDDITRTRIKNAFDEFYEVHDNSDFEIANLIASLHIDILVDLKGHTRNARLGILSYRPAPVQVHYLGYPGTLGASFVDYIFADSIIIPIADQRYYNEKIVYLPNSYQVNDRSRKISALNDSRVDHGLPESGFVFCCFNNNWKITPDVFDVWMSILTKVKGSVLWLLEDNFEALANLKIQANCRGVASDRLVFAKRVGLEEHLSRHRHADLFLDTFHCNAHTTASDSLWAGLPVLTKQGTTFASRVASSLLMAVGLPELITETPESYESLALELAGNQVRLSAIKKKLIDTRKISALFDTPRFTRNLETAYKAIWSRYKHRLNPDHIYIKE